MKKRLLFLIILIVTGFTISYPSVNRKLFKSYVVTTYYYRSNIGFQRLEPGHNTEDPITGRSVISTYFKNIHRWTDSYIMFTPTYSQIESYIGSLSFNLDTNADGAYDGALTLQEALNAVWNYYTFFEPYTMPSSIVVDGVVIIEISKATSEH